MKRIISIAILMAVCLVGAVSCTEHSGLDPVRTKESPMIISKVRTVEEAISIACQAANMLDSTSTRANRLVNINDIKVILNPHTRTAGGDFDSDTLIYVVNFAENSGFALVSANRSTESLLGITESGSYDGGISEIEGFNDFMSLAKLYVGEAYAFDPIIPSFDIDSSIYCRTPLLQWSWGQQNHAGQYCPNGIAGCVPLAVAQILAYYRKPDVLPVYYSGTDTTYLPMNWNDIRSHKLYYLDNNGNESSTYCNASDSAHNAIGLLCRQLGYKMYSIYHMNGSGTGTSADYVPSCFWDYGYTCGTFTSYNAGMSKPRLQNLHPLLFVGIHEDEQGTRAGHAWIVDGYEEITYYRVTYTLNDKGLYEATYTPTGATLYNHVNWGWEGRNNGYFLDGVFDITQYHDFPSYPYPPTNIPYNFCHDVMFVEPYY